MGHVARNIGGVYETPDADFEIFRNVELAVDAAGGLLLAGTERGLATGDDVAQLLRLTPQGTLDTSFGTGGIVEPGAPGEDSFLRGVVVLDGTTYVLGSDQVSGSADPKLFVQAYDASGSPVNAFGGSRIDLLDLTPPAMFTQPSFARFDATPEGTLLVGYLDTDTTPPVGLLEVTPGATATVTQVPTGFPASQPVSVTLPAFGANGDTFLAASALLDSGSLDLVVRRLLPNDTFDPSFGTDGVSINSSGTRGSQSNLGSTADSLGRAVFVGQSSSSFGGSFVVGRLDASGQPDESFGVNGVQDIGESGVSRAVDVASDNSVIAVGSRIGFTNDGIEDFGRAVRFNPDGSRDSSFDLDAGDFNNFGYDELPFIGVAALDDGGAYVLGSGFRDFLGSERVLLKLTPNATLDTNFGNQGIVVLPDVDGSFTNSLLVQSDGGVIVARDAFSSIDIRRYSSNGTPDASFGDGGAATVSISVFGEVEQAADGDLLVAGAEQDVGFVTRLTADGVVDATWGDPATPGVASVPLTSTSDTLGSVVEQADGTVAFAGTFRQGDDDAFVGQFTSDGLLDDTFADGGVLRVDLGGSSDFVRDVAATSTGLIVTGQASVFGNRDWAAFRIAPPTLAGDANGDGVVNLADFGILRGEFGQSGTSLFADFNGDGIVNLADFGILRANFGARL